MRSGSHALRRQPFAPLRTEFVRQVGGRDRARRIAVRPRQAGARQPLRRARCGRLHHARQRGHAAGFAPQGGLPVGASSRVSLTSRNSSSGRLAASRARWPSSSSSTAGLAASGASGMFKRDPVMRHGSSRSRCAAPCRAPAARCMLGQAGAAGGRWRSAAWRPALSLNTVEASLPRSSRAVRRSDLAREAARRLRQQAAARIEADPGGRARPSSSVNDSWILASARVWPKTEDGMRPAPRRAPARAFRPRRTTSSWPGASLAPMRADGGGRRSSVARGAGPAGPRARPSPRPAATHARESACRPARRRARVEFVARIGDRRQACHGRASGGWSSGRGVGCT